MQAFINDENNDILLSTASIWEMAIKQSTGQLNFKLPFEVFITQQSSLNDFNLLNIKLTHITVVATLPLHHRNPFDRLLIAQAMVEQIPILSADAVFDVYPCLYISRFVSSLFIIAQAELRSTIKYN